MTEIFMTLAEPFEPANERTRKDLLERLGCSSDDHKARILVEASVGTESREVYIELRSKHPDEFGYRQSLGILTISERELEALVAVLKAMNPTHA
jgi:hypothetical protein